MTAVQLKDVVTVAPRFTRAISVERDATVPKAIEGYVITATAQQTLVRFARALAGHSGHRAWTITGPYGTGKSAFALYLTHLFGPAQAPGGSLARSMLRSQCGHALREIFGSRKGKPLA